MRWRFRPLPSLVSLAVAAICLRLMVWQLHRYAESEATTARITAAWEAEPVTAVLSGGSEDLSWRRAALRGRWSEGDLVVAKGGLIAGMPGYQWFEVLQQERGPDVLVDRGWVPVDIEASALLALRPAGQVEVEGILLPLTGPTSLEPVIGADGLHRYPLHTDLVWGVLPRALGLPLAAIAVHAPRPVAAYALRTGPMFHDERERRAGAPPVGGYMLPTPRTHNLSYAAQWLAFALMALGIGGWMNLERIAREAA